MTGRATHNQYLPHSQSRPGYIKLKLGWTVYQCNLYTADLSILFFLFSDYNPLMGGGGGAGYRPSRRGGGGWG